MDNQKTERYLEACEMLFREHQDVDPELRYGYYVEMARALVDADVQLRTKYDAHVEAAHEAVLEYYGTQEDISWQFNYDRIFEVRNSFLFALFRLIESSDTAGIEEIVGAQLDFARMQLHAQKRVLDIIICMVPMRTLMFDNCSGGERYARASQNCESARNYLNDLRRKML